MSVNWQEHEGGAEFDEYLHRMELECEQSKRDTAHWEGDRPPVNPYAALGLVAIAISASTAAWAICRWIVPLVLRWFR